MPSAVERPFHQPVATDIAKQQLPYLSYSPHSSLLLAFSPPSPPSPPLSPHQLAPHYNTVAELRAEYEMSMRKREQEKLLAMTHPEVRNVSSSLCSLEQPSTALFSFTLLFLPPSLHAGPHGARG